MNIREAEKLNYSILEQAKLHAKRIGYDEETVANFFNQEIEIIYEEGQSFLDLREKESISYKMKNVMFINLKTLLITMASLGLSIGIPNSVLQAASMLISVLLSVCTLPEKQLTNIEGYALSYLHEKDCYEKELECELFFEEFKNIYLDTTGDNLSKNTLEKALVNLDALGVIELKEDKVILKEKVVRNTIQLNIKE